MLTGFEEYTFELTPEEISFIPDIVRSLKKYTISNPISNQAIADGILKHKGKKIHASRVRKIISEITVSGIMPNLGASGRGYFTLTTSKDLEEYRESLVGRANQILRRAAALKLPDPEPPVQVPGSQAALFETAPANIHNR